MNRIDLKPTPKTPGIILDDEALLFEMTGISRPENIRDLYPVLKTLEEFMAELIDNPPSGDYLLKIKFKLDYFNSASAKFIADIVLLADEYVKNDCNIKILWYFPEDDNDMLEAGEYFAEIIDMPISFIAFTNEK